MANGLTASWNNFNIRYYSSVGAECPVRCGWDNNPSSAFRFQVETYWYGNYAALSNANDVLTAIRKNNVTIVSPANTKMIEAAGVMLQGLVFSEIATNYDQGFIVTEATDLSTPEKVQALNFSTGPGLRFSRLDSCTSSSTFRRRRTFGSTWGGPGWGCCRRGPCV